MINDPLSLEQVLKFLNGLVELDRDAVERLIETRTFCNRELEAHPTVQTYGREDRVVAGVKISVPIVGVLGVLNGMFGTLPAGPKKGWGPIAAVFDDKGKLLCFRLTDDPSIKHGVPTE